jgi:hypothetical protein
VSVRGIQRHSGAPLMSFFECNFLACHLAPELAAGKLVQCIM